MDPVYFKKNDGEVILYSAKQGMNLDKLKAKFVECDKDGNEIKKVAKKSKKKESK
tara:strand:+ start:15173 stop:15337 length:165 start_codon:yes stop_codon:yes gene_type:complete